MRHFVGYRSYLVLKSSEIEIWSRQSHVIHKFPQDRVTVFPDTIIRLATELLLLLLLLLLLFIYLFIFIVINITSYEYK